jgi:hypothetical protein
MFPMSITYLQAFFNNLANHLSQAGVQIEAPPIYDEEYESVMQSVMAVESETQSVMAVESETQSVMAVKSTQSVMAVMSVTQVVMAVESVTQSVVAVKPCSFKHKQLKGYAKWLLTTKPRSGPSGHSVDNVCAKISVY